MNDLEDHFRRQRGYAEYFQWRQRDRREARNVMERGIVSDWLDAAYRADLPFTHLDSRGADDPPDCELTHKDGRKFAVEVTELVDCTTIEANNRSGRYDMKDYSPEFFVGRLTDILRDKDSKRLKGGPYTHLILIIFTDEPLLDPQMCADAVASFCCPGLQQIREAYLLFPPAPNISGSSTDEDDDCRVVPIPMANSQEDCSVGT